MSEQWLNYTALGKLWGMSPEAARTRARSGNYRRRVGNDGQAEVLVDTAAPVRKARPSRSAGQSRTPALDTETTPPATTAALDALQGHIDTLKAELAKAEALATERGQEVAAERAKVADLTAQPLKITADLLDARKAEAARPRGWSARLVG